MNPGVIIARFQTHRLHSGHKALLRAVRDIHGHVIVLLGVSPLKSTGKNPLTFEQRKDMLRQFNPLIQVLPLHDCRTNESWSQLVDAVVPEGLVLYGGRDSFIPYYSGVHKCIELPITCDESATQQRDAVHESYYFTEDFRAGVVFGAKNKWINQKVCVDIAIIDHGMVLLGRKPDETNFQFIGGFVDSGETLEHAAVREAKEETGLDVRNIRYLQSLVVNDWRYQGEAEGLTTAFFSSEYRGGTPAAMDDIAEVKWFNFRKDVPIIDGHREMLNSIRGVYAL